MDFLVQKLYFKSTAECLEMKIIVLSSICVSATYLTYPPSSSKHFFKTVCRKLVKRSNVGRQKFQTFEMLNHAVIAAQLLVTLHKNKFGFELTFNTSITLEFLLSGQLELYGKTANERRIASKECLAN